MASQLKATRRALLCANWLWVFLTAVTCLKLSASEAIPERRVLYYQAQGQIWALPVSTSSTGVYRFNHTNHSVLLKVVRISRHSIKTQVYTLTNPLTLIDDIFHQANYLGMLHLTAARCDVLAPWGVVALSVRLEAKLPMKSQGHSPCYLNIKP